MDETVKVSANALRNRHGQCTDKFDRLDADLVGTYEAEPALPVEGGDLERVRVRYKALVRQQTDLDMAVGDFVRKEDLDADRDWSAEEPVDTRV